MIRKILYLEDSEEDFLLFRETLRKVHGPDEWDVFFVDHALTPLEARALMSIERYEVVVVDMQLGADSGIEFVHEVWRKHAQRPMILTSGQRSIEFDARTVELITRGRLQYLSKYQMTGEHLSHALCRALSCTWRVLVFDGEQQVSATVATMQQELDQACEVEVAASPDDARELMKIRRFDACLIDCSLPNDRLDELLWAISRIPDQDKPAVIFAGCARTVADPPLIQSARGMDLGLLRLDEASPDALVGVIAQACGESQWRNLRAELHS